MQELAGLLRSMQLYSHNAHNLCKGSLFFQDHDFLGELYPMYEKAYDMVIERCIGLGMSLDLVALQEYSVSMLKMYPSGVKESKVYFQTLLDMEKSICSLVESHISSASMSEGTKQMLGTLCDESEQRQYKLKQRAK